MHCASTNPLAANVRHVPYPWNPYSRPAGRRNWPESVVQTFFFSWAGAWGGLGRAIYNSDDRLDELRQQNLAAFVLVRLEGLAVTFTTPGLPALLLSSRSLNGQSKMTVQHFTYVGKDD